MFYIDAHCDSVMQWLDPAFAQSEKPHQLDFTRMKITPGGLQWMACFPPDRAKAYHYVSRLLDTLEATQADACLPTVLTGRDLQILQTQSKWGVLRSIEGGEALEGQLARVDEFFSRGVRALGLTWNHPNELSGGASTPAQGLTAFGRDVIARLETLGMVVDLAHLSPAGFWDALSCVTHPVAVSHTASAALRAHRRNLTDEQIRGVAQQGGVIGVCLYPPFLSEGDCDLYTVARHILHIHNVGGRDHVGIGTDFDGIEVPPDGIRDVTDMPKLWDALLAMGMSQDDVSLLAGGNWSRLLLDCLLA